MTDKIYNVLILCTGNSARSIMAEALISSLGQGRFRGYSAGSQPGGIVNPYALEQIKDTGYAPEHLRSKSWDEFAAADAPHMDFIITVCDNAAGEVCPYWPGHPLTAHWGFADPAAVAGTDAEKRAAFHRIFLQIKAKVEILVALPLPTMDAAAIRAELQHIGELPV